MAEHIAIAGTLTRWCCRVPGDSQWHGVSKTVTPMPNGKPGSKTILVPHNSGWNPVISLVFRLALSKWGQWRQWLTIWLNANSIRLSVPMPHHPHHFCSRCPACQNPSYLSWL